MESGLDLLERLMRLIAGGGQSFIASAGIFLAVFFYREKERERAAGDAKIDASVERLLAEQSRNRDLAISSNSVTVANTTALEADRVLHEKVLASNERVIAALDRQDGRAGK